MINNKQAAEIFRDYLKGQRTRIIFRYSASASMSLKYAEQVIKSDKKWNPKKRVYEYKTKKARMIVCDRLIPIDPQLEGQYQYYVADSDIFDGFMKEHGCWNFIKNIGAGNNH